MKTQGLHQQHTCTERNTNGSYLDWNVVMKDKRNCKHTINISECDGTK